MTPVLRQFPRSDVTQTCEKMRSVTDGSRPASSRLTWRKALPRGWRKVLAICAALVLTFAVVTARLLVWPIQGAPATADAVVLFAGPGDRIPVALQLAREHRAPVLVVSQGWMGYGGPCPAPTPGVRTICFEPSPGNTRGEAEYVGRLAQRYDWHSLILVVAPTQAVRAQLLVARCFGGHAYTVTAPVGNWPYQLAYGWGALVKAVFTHRSC